MKNYVYCLLLALVSFLAQTKTLRGQEEGSGDSQPGEASFIRNVVVV